VRPLGLFRDQPTLVFLLAGLLRFLLGCHLTILPSIIHGCCNDHLLQLSECIESINNEVKQKMMFEGRCSGVRKSHESNRMKIFLQDGQLLRRQRRKKVKLLRLTFFTLDRKKRFEEEKLFSKNII
jgi:hypothetical protein